MIGRYTKPEMAKVWARQARFEAWRRVEAAWLETLEAHDEVPAGVAAACAEAVVDLERIDALEATLRHEVIAFVEALKEGLGDEGRWIHHGLTSSDVMDTGLALQATAALDVCVAAHGKWIQALLALARRHIALPAAGRTHGMHAEPAAFGVRFARHAAAALRDRARLQGAREALAVGKFAGAVGGYSFYPPECEEEALGRLGLQPETVPSQVVARDRHAQALQALALAGATMETFAVEVRHLQRTEVGEAEEPFTAGQKGSSAMPHKRNPIVSERLTGLARLLRGYAQTATENVALWHERDISHSSTERVTLPDATGLFHYMAVRAAGVAEGLVVHEERVRANLEAGGGVMFSQAALLALVEAGLSREEAYEVVQGAAFAAGKEGFREALASDSRAKALGGLEAVFDPTRYLAHAKGTLRRAEELARQAGL